MILRNPGQPLQSCFHDKDDQPGGCEVVVVMGAGAASGFIMGLLLPGGFLMAGAVFLLVIGAGGIGWWARGWSDE